MLVEELSSHKGHSQSPRSCRTGHRFRQTIPPPPYTAVSAITYAAATPTGAAGHSPMPTDCFCLGFLGPQTTPYSDPKPHRTVARRGLSRPCVGLPLSIAPGHMYPGVGPEWGASRHPATGCCACGDVARAFCAHGVCWCGVGVGKRGITHAGGDLVTLIITDRGETLQPPTTTYATALPRPYTR